MSVNSHVNSAIVDEVWIDGLETNDLLPCFATLFRHVTLRGKIGEIKINKAYTVVDRRESVSRAFDEERERFYRQIDWALDIREAELREFEVEGIPVHLIRRDPTTQAIVKRDKAAQPGWQEKVSAWNDHWKFVIEESRYQEDLLLVAPKRAPKKEFRRLLDGIKELRDLGVAEPD